MGAQPKCRTQPRILDGDVRHQMGHGRGEDDKLLFFCTFMRVVLSLQHECVSFGNWYVGSSGSNIRTCEYIGNTRKRQRLSLSAVHSQRAKKTHPTSSRAFFNILGDGHPIILEVVLTSANTEDDFGSQPLVCAEDLLPLG